jgi:hypothetical protein
VWPPPFHIELSGPALLLSPDFIIDGGSSTSPTLLAGIGRYLAIVQSTQAALPHRKSDLQLPLPPTGDNTQVPGVMPDLDLSKRIPTATLDTLRVKVETARSKNSDGSKSSKSSESSNGNADALPGPTTDYSYSLNISTTTTDGGAISVAIVTAASVYGALYGLGEWAPSVASAESVVDPYIA